MSDTISRAMSRQPHSDDPLAGVPTKVLLVGGTEADTIGLKERLDAARRIRVEPEHVARAADALVCLSQEPFDAALLDLTALPPDALAVITAGAPGLPLIVLVGREDDSRGIAALKGGAQDYLIKEDLHPDALERSILYAIERKRSEEEAQLRQSGWSYAQLVDSLDCIVWEADAATFAFTFVSKQAARILGYPVERWTTEPTFWRDHIHPEDREWAPSFCARATREKRTHEFEYRMLDADGRTVWLRDLVTVVVLNDQPVRLRGVMVDITEHKRIEQELRNSEEQYRAIFEASTDGVVISALDGTVLEVNPAFAAALGYTREELLHMDARMWVHPDSHSNIVDFLHKVRAGERYHVIGKQVRKDGTVYPAEVFGIPFLYNGQRHTLAIIHDITERVQAQELLEQRVEERTRELTTLLVENARLYEQAQENTRKTAALAQVASQVAFGGSLQQTLDVLCRRVVEVTGSLASSVVLQDGAQLRMAGTCGLPPGYAEGMNNIFESGTSLIAQPAFAGQKPVSIANMRQTILANPAYTAIHHFVAEAPWDTVVAVPMIYRDRAVGVLLSYHPPHHDVGGAQMAFHTVIADQAAVAVENARLVVQAHDKARLEERQRLARELHDSVTQALFSISLIARSAEVLLQREGTHSAGILEKLADLRQLTQGALAEMRALIFELRPGALEEEGLLEALRKHTAAVQGREMLPVDLEAPAPGALPRLKPAAEEALYRITQEALHNVVKHARATRAAVCLRVQEGFVFLQVRDDGIGFAMDAVPAGHMGLGTMRQRTEALGGEYEIESRPGGGTMITVRVPLAEWQQ